MKKSPKPVMQIMIIALFTTVLILCSIEGSGSRALPDPSLVPGDPIILSENPDNKVLRLWVPPGDEISVLYDQWQIIISGNISEYYKIVIGGVVVFNGSMEETIQNFSYNANNLNLVSVSIDIGNRSYEFPNLIVNHQSIGYDGPGFEGEKSKYTQTDINVASLRSAFGVVVTSLISIPVVWFLVKTWKRKQGVSQL